MAGTLVLHDFDVAHELGLATPDALIDNATLQPHAAQITALIHARLTMIVDGREVRWDITGIRAVPDRSAIEVAWRVPLTTPGRAPDRSCGALSVRPQPSDLREFV